MSDRMTSPGAGPEIEDVLSSVRRLVSEEVARDRSARLVLTPAFRVAAPEPEPGFTPDPDPAPAAQAREEDDLPLEARIAELEAALAVQSAEFEPDYERGEHAEFPPLREVAAVAGTVSEAAVESVPEAGIEPAADPLPQPVAATPEPESEPESNPDPEPAAAFEAAPADPAPAGGGNAPEAGMFDDADVLIDEESLRLLVRDILREELQGPLGERITRNVRKLVRAEIARTLAASQVTD